MRLWTRCIALLAVSLLVDGCRCGDANKSTIEEPARPREVKLVEQALESYDYEGAVAELEKNPEEALRAVRQANAQPHSRRAVLLKIMENRLKRPRTYRDWQRRLDEAADEQLGTVLGPRYTDPGLSDSEHDLFWAQVLLTQGGGTKCALAADKLAQLGGEVARDALAAEVKRAGGDLCQRVIADALVAAGEGRALADAIASLSASERPESFRTNVSAFLAYNLGQLSPDRAEGTADEVLSLLEKNDLPAAERAGYLRALGAVASEKHLERLAALRRAPWAGPLQKDIDAAIEAVLTREPPPKPNPSPGPAK